MLVCSRRSRPGSRFSVMRFWLDLTATPLHTQRERKTSRTWRQDRDSSGEYGPKVAHSYALMSPDQRRPFTFSSIGYREWWDGEFICTKCFHEPNVILGSSNIPNHCLLKWPAAAPFEQHLAASGLFISQSARFRHKTQTLWFRPCLSNREIMDLMWFSWMMFRTSGLSISTQYSTSRIPGWRTNSSIMLKRW